MTGSVNHEFNNLHRVNAGVQLIRWCPQGQMGPRSGGRRNANKISRADKSGDLPPSVRQILAEFRYAAINVEEMPNRITLCHKTMAFRDYDRLCGTYPEMQILVAERAAYADMPRLAVRAEFGNDGCRQIDWGPSKHASTVKYCLTPFFGSGEPDDIVG